MTWIDQIVEVTGWRGEPVEYGWDREEAELGVRLPSDFKELTRRFPAGAFYAFPDCREAIKTLHKAGRIAEPTDLALCDYLLAQEKGVAAVPGSAFGAEGYLRISFATSMENIKKAVERMSAAMTLSKVPA